MTSSSLRIALDDPSHTHRIALLVAIGAFRLWRSGGTSAAIPARGGEPFATRVELSSGHLRQPSRDGPTTRSAAAANAWRMLAAP